jgi:serine protease inhibitor
LPEGSTVAPGVTVREVASTVRADQMALQTVAFDLTSSHDLLEEAEVFGLVDAQDRDEGHFPGISQVPLAVDAAAQQAKAEFSATGFKAAAVTAIGMVRAAAAQPRRTYRVRQVEVAFDRPFGWVAVDVGSGLVVAFGWVQQPPAVRQRPERDVDVAGA